MTAASAALVAAGHGALSTGLPGLVLIAGALGLVAGGVAIGLGIARVDRRVYDLEVPGDVDAPALPSNVIVLADVTGDDLFAEDLFPDDVEADVQQALAVANEPAPRTVLHTITGGAS